MTLERKCCAVKWSEKSLLETCSNWLSGQFQAAETSEVNTDQMSVHQLLRGNNWLLSCYVMFHYTDQLLITFSVICCWEGTVCTPFFKDFGIKLDACCGWNTELKCELFRPNNELKGTKTLQRDERGPQSTDTFFLKCCVCSSCQKMLPDIQNSLE